MNRLTPDMLLRAYAYGIFPMAEGRSDPAVHWIEPEQRGIIPLDHFHVPKRLRRTVRQGVYDVRCDSNFAAVIRGCLARDPQDRPSPLDVVNELRAIDGLPPVVGSATPGPAAAADPDGERIRRQFDAALRAKGGRPPSRRSR